MPLKLEHRTLYSKNKSSAAYDYFPNSYGHLSLREEIPFITITDAILRLYIAYNMFLCSI
jgi:hypothetical protein